MNISKDNCIKLILEKFPDFFPLWHIYKTEWDSCKAEYSGTEICGVIHFWSDTSLCGEMAEFSSYVSELLIKEKFDSSKINEIFSYMEYLLVNGDEDVKDAVATCFLENIINKSPEQIDPKRFVKYLGPASQEYCRGWDKFTGVQTEGLWDEDIK